MTTPDLAALRALVEAVGTTLPRAPRLAHAEDCGCDDPHHRRGWDSERLIELTQWRTSLGPLWIAALEAMDRMKGDSAALHADETGHLHAQLEAALLKYGQHGPRCPIWATQTRGTCTCGLDAALEDRDE